MSWETIARAARYRVLKLYGTAATGLLLAGCNYQGYDVMDPRGPIGRQEWQLLVNATIIMLAVVIPVIIMTIAFAWHYREGNRKAKRDLDWHYSGRIEFVVWAIPALVILFLGGVTWVSSHDLDPPKPIESTVPTLEVDVVSLDWKWLFIYPAQGVASVNKLVMPVGTPVHFRMTSASVMNTFFIPRLGSMVYTMAGMQTQLNLLADEAGTYRGLSGNFSGEGFSDMTFDTSVVSADDFKQWAEATHAAGSTLDAAAYQTLMRPSVKDAPHTYGGVAPGLFEALMAHPGEAPTVEQIAHFATPTT